MRINISTLLHHTSAPLLDRMTQVLVGCTLLLRYRSVAVEHGLQDQHRRGGRWALPVVVAMGVALVCLTIGATVMIDLPDTSVMQIPLRGGGALTVQVGPLIEKYYMRVEPSPITLKRRGSMQIDVWYRPIGIGRRHYALRLPAWPMLVLGSAGLLAAVVGWRRAMRTSHSASEGSDAESDIPARAQSR